MPRIDPRELEEAGGAGAGGEVRRQIERLQYDADIIREILAFIEIEALNNQQVSDQRRVEDRYPSGGMTKSSIFQTSPGNISGYATLEGFDQITGEPIPRGQESQYLAQKSQMDPIRLFMKFGEDIPNDPSNFYRKRIIGVDADPVTFQTVLNSATARHLRTTTIYNGPAPLTYEPAGSVNIIWNLPGSKGERVNGELVRRWAKTPNAPLNNVYQDSTVQWALAVNAGQMGDEISPLVNPDLAWDRNDPNRKPLRKQLIFKNRLPQPATTPNQGQENQPGENNQGLIFNMAQAMINLARLSSPPTPQQIRLPQEIIDFAKRIRSGLYPAADESEIRQAVKRMLILAAVPGDPNSLQKHQYVQDRIGSVENVDPADPNRIIDFSATNDSRVPAVRLASAEVTFYDVYLFCRGRILNGANERISPPSIPARLLQLDEEVIFRLLAQLPDFNTDNVSADRLNDIRLLTLNPKYFFRDQLNSFVDFEFFDFNTINPWSRDRFTDMISRAPGRLQMPPSRNERNQVQYQFPFNNFAAGMMVDAFGGYVNPEYSYFNGAYEQASAIMPEALLPNMYVYELATGNQNDIPPVQQSDFGVTNFLGVGAGGGSGTGTAGLQRQAVAAFDDQGRRTGHAMRVYDKLITLDQFENFSLIALGGSNNEEDERESFQDYLNSYAEAVKGSNVTIDFTSRLNNTFYNLSTPPDELDMYDNFYKLKNYFPMYIEVGIPCYNALGPIGKSLLSTDDPETEEIDFDLGFKSSGLINSILGTTPIRTNFTIRSAGLVSTTYDKNQSVTVRDDRDRASRGEDFSAEVVRTKVNNQGLNVYDFDTLIDNVMQLQEEDNLNFRQGGVMSKISFRGPQNENLNPVQTGELADFLESVKQEAERVCRTKMVKYQDLMITKRKLVAETETIMYKLSKIDHGTGEILQNYFFPASERSRMIRFVDTQVKYGKKYLYELRAFDIVYGSTFRFRNRWAYYPEATEERINGQIPRNLYGDQQVSFSFNVETLPSIKIVENPIYTFTNTLALVLAAGFDSFTQAFTTLEAGQMGGVSYPIAAVYDRPPMPPEPSIIPFQGDKNKILFNFSSKVGELVRDKTVPYVSLMPSDEERYLQISDNQRSVENFTLPRGHIEFRSEGGNEIKKVEIFRTTELNMDVPTEQALYRSFENRLYKTLDISLDPEDPSGNYARSFDFIDDIQPNIDYYYTFRMGDVHDNTSNPTEIYRVRIDSLEANSFYVIEEVKLRKKSLKKPTKDMTRYLEIQASDIQSQPYVAAAEGDITTSIRSLVDDDTDNKVENNTFLIRISSKDTGRKIDIKTSFVLKQERIG